MHCNSYVVWIGNKLHTTTEQEDMRTRITFRAETIWQLTGTVFLSLFLYEIG